VNRRQFLGSASTYGALVVGTFLSPVAYAAGSRFSNPTFAAFLETVIPGPKHDPRGGPGALEVETPRYFDEMDRSGLFPISLTLVQVLVTHALTAVAVARHLRPFWALSQEQRERIVESVSGIIGLPFLLRLARAPFYVATVNRQGLDWIGLPVAPPEGYPRTSWGIPLSNPAPGSVNGNLP
jgi:hypothetical protein